MERSQYFRRSKLQADGQISSENRFSNGLNWIAPGEGEHARVGASKASNCPPRRGKDQGYPARSRKSTKHEAAGRRNQPKPVPRKMRGRKRAAYWTQQESAGVARSREQNGAEKNMR